MVDIERRKEGRIRSARATYAYWTEHPTTMELFNDSLAVLDERVRAIRLRGGDVTLIRLPVGPTIWATSDSVFPRELFWDRLASQSSAKVPHYRDDPGLHLFILPDESHLDFRDAPDFTRALAEAVSRR